MSSSIRCHILGFVLLGLLGLMGCQTHQLGTSLTRTGDEIVVAGQLFHTGTRVITWLDPHGYDAYRVERRFSPLASSDWEKTKVEAKEVTTPNRLQPARKFAGPRRA